MFIVCIFWDIIFGPFLNIWAINTLFGLGIAYTFKTWMASIILGAIVGGCKISKK